MSRDEMEAQLASGTGNFSAWYPLIYKLLKQRASDQIQPETDD
jgi:hypothetical protein